VGPTCPGFDVLVILVPFKIIINGCDILAVHFEFQGLMFSVDCLEVKIISTVLYCM